MPKIEYLDYRLLNEFNWKRSDSQLFRKAQRKNLGPEYHGSFSCGWDEYILEAAEDEGHDWPFSCRAGACADCTAMVVGGKVEMDMQQILSDAEVEEQNLHLTCIGTPATASVKLLINTHAMPKLQNRVIGDHDELNFAGGGTGNQADSYQGDSSSSGTEVYENSQSGTEVFTADETAPSETEPLPTKDSDSIPSNFCPDCGQDISSLSNPAFCPNCGFEMS